MSFVLLTLQVAQNDHNNQPAVTAVARCGRNSNTPLRMKAKGKVIPCLHEVNMSMLTMLREFVFLRYPVYAMLTLLTSVFAADLDALVMTEPQDNEAPLSQHDGHHAAKPESDHVKRVRASALGPDAYPGLQGDQQHSKSLSVAVRSGAVSPAPDAEYAVETAGDIQKLPSGGKGALKPQQSPSGAAALEAEVRDWCLGRSQVNSSVDQEAGAY
jgi:hypothetical protein